MAISAEDIKRLREETQAGVMDCKKALEESGGDYFQAKQILYDKGVQKMAQRTDREASQGIIETYVHQGRIGAMVEVNTETDFVARNEAFRELARNVAQQVAAMNPRYLSKEEIKETDVERPEDIALLEMPFIREPAKTISDLVNDVRVTTKENVQIRRFVRFEVGK
jgi:elongation factor Ts